MDDKKTSDLDQSTAFLADVLPPLWRRLYLNCVAEGFERTEALSLVRAYIVACNDGPKLEK